eukprot:CAMPEP_0184408200 /NCGR_PEP_ID=MMETSP0738-20130409/3043_1 /TAXON_ID=385413 /ORGANISM="Thalassiosira miniscula, Strain CCMP1093" /LENGTH=108 /DNA_ID=CAMNT_0026765569 /DNA_START=15 /DNA_END=341 /DNA_ORIENTATION=-
MTRDSLATVMTTKPSSEPEPVVEEKSLIPDGVIDDQLVATINHWLSQGISVTRTQGLEFANTLLKERRKEEEADGNVVDWGKGGEGLTAKWWRNFLERNRHKLVCSQE